MRKAFEGVMTVAMDIRDEGKIRDWLGAMHCEIPHTYVLPRILELDAALGALDEAGRAAFRMQQRMMLAIENTGYKLSKEQLQRADKLVALGRGTPYGAELQKRSIDADAQLTWQINNHSRPPRQEAI
jgi:hypothetical protein